MQRMTHVFDIFDIFVFFAVGVCAGSWVLQRKMKHLHAPLNVAPWASANG